MDMQKLAFALQGLGAGLQGQNTAPYVQGAQALSEERKKAMAQDAFTAYQYMQTGQNDKVVSLLENRVNQIKRLNGDPSDTLETLQWARNGEWDKVSQDLGKTVQVAQQTGLLEGPERVGTMGGQVIERAPDGSYRAVTPEGYDPNMAGGNAKYGLTPTFVEGPNGLEVVQLSSQGGARPVDLGEGYKAVDPYQKALMTGRGSGQARLETETGLTPILGEQEYTKTTASNRAQAETIGDVEAAKLEGRGDVPEKEKQHNAKKRVTGNLKQMARYYRDLKQSGAIISTDQGSLENLSASARSSNFGQALGRRVGSEEQSIRDKINNMRPALINDIRQASEMGARGLDTEKELEFYLQMASDPKRDIQSNLAALEVLNRAYGLGTQLPGVKESAIRRAREEAENAIVEDDGNTIEVDF